MKRNNYAESHETNSETNQPNSQTIKRKDKPDLNLGQVEIDTERLKSDFEVLDKYLSFSSELLRLSLLGIAALAFLLKEIFTASKPDQTNRYVARFRQAEV